MEKIFIPYKGRKPAAISINGHDLLILSPVKAVIEDELAAVGADRVRELKWEGSEAEREQILGQLAQKARSGVVLAEDGQNMTEVLDSLRQSLPWLQ